MGAVTVEEVSGGPVWRQFLDLGFILGDTPRDREWLLGRQRRRLATRPHPLVLAGGEISYFLAWSRGRPAGRLTAHVDPDAGEGRFGFLVLQRPGALDVARALLASAGRWLARRHREVLVGPMSFTGDEEAGVLVYGHDEPAVTGRAWTPEWYAAILEATGLTVYEELSSFRLPAAPEAGGGGVPTDVSGPVTQVSMTVPADLASFADPALMLQLPDGRGAVVAVPDVGPALGAGRLRGAWSLARRARRHSWEGCVITALDGPEEVLVPALCTAAGEAGYRWVLSPWAPAGTPPVLRHRLYRGDTAVLGAD